MGVLVQKGPTVLMSDSSSTIAIVDKPGLKDKTKHIALRYFAVRKLQEKGIVKVMKIGTDHNPSDIGTKALGSVTFLRHLQTVAKPNPSRALQELNINKFSANAERMDNIAQLAVAAAKDEWKVVNRRTERTGFGTIPSLGQVWGAKL
jgi:hypothetical protein